MARFHSRLQPGSADFEVAAAQMRARVDELKRRLADTGEGGDATVRGPEAFAALIRSELPKWAKVVKDSGVRID